MGKVTGTDHWLEPLDCRFKCYGAYLLTITNSLSPNSDQYQISLCKINAHSTPEVMRIEDYNHPR